MREIKFRGLNEDTGLWVYGYYTKLVEGARRFDAIIADVDGELTGYYIHSKKTIGQFTGLTDINGISIYEGDILTLNFGIPPKLAHMKVEWFHGGFEINCWDSSPAVCHIGDLYDQLDDMAVIGNIYENPELLEKNND